MRTLFFLSILLLSGAFCSAKDIHFWDTQRKGTNFFSNTPRKERFTDAQKTGIQITRIACNKWLNGRPEKQIGDFLIGPKDEYNGIVQEDLNYLIQVLDDAHQSGSKVVLTMLSLPGSRWSQHNIVDGKRKQQTDLWKDFEYHHQCADFWGDLAEALRDHPAVVGYNVINEPCPERGSDRRKLQDWYVTDYESWYQEIQGTPADLNLFYKTVIEAIRSVDRQTPIVVDSGFYANPYAITILDPETLNDPNLLYAIHNYVPGRYTFGEPGSYTYPGHIPTGERSVEGVSNASPPFAPLVYWDQATFKGFFKPMMQWMEIHRIPANRVYVSEFGVNRLMKGASEYLRDSIAFYNEQGWHWSFYCFREDDGFQIMDYELGTGPLPKGYWNSMETYTYSKNRTYPNSNPLWEVIEKGLKMN